MSPVTSNSWLTFPVLRGGVRVHNPKSTPTGGTLGTLGFIGVDSSGQRWLVSCYHVLCRMTGAFPAGATEFIYHPDSLSSTLPIAIQTDAKIDEALDCAAARLIGSSEPQIHAIGKLNKPVDPVIGMRVIKSGASTGVTEGHIVGITGDIEIAPIAHVDKYDLSEGGDSGALWVDADTMSPVALHYLGSEGSGAERAFAKPIKAILASLQLEIA